jgi:hypothetical protein
MLTHFEAHQQIWDLLQSYKNFLKYESHFEKGSGKKFGPGEFVEACELMGQYHKLRDQMILTLSRCSDEQT